MQTKICKVVAQTEVVRVPSKKNENGQTSKCTIRLRQLGSDYEDEYLCAMFGSLAESRFSEGTIVIASLRFSTHENEGKVYQDVVCTEIVPIKN